MMSHTTQLMIMLSHDVAIKYDEAAQLNGSHYRCHDGGHDSHSRAELQAQTQYV